MQGHKRIDCIYVIREPETRTVKGVVGARVTVDGQRREVRVENQATSKDELESLRRSLYAMGFSKRAIATAVKSSALAAGTSH